MLDKPELDDVRTCPLENIKGGAMWKSWNIYEKGIVIDRLRNETHLNYEQIAFRFDLKSGSSITAVRQQLANLSRLEEKDDDEEEDDELDFTVANEAPDVEDERVKWADRSEESKLLVAAACRNGGMVIKIAAKELGCSENTMSRYYTKVRWQEEKVNPSTSTKAGAVEPEIDAYTVGNRALRMAVELRNQNPDLVLVAVNPRKLNNGSVVMEAVQLCRIDELK